MPTVEQLEKLLSLDPSDPFVHYGLAQEHAKGGDHEQALVCYSKVIELDAEYCYAYYFKGQSLFDLGRVEDAMQILREGIAVAQRLSDNHAHSELAGLLDSMA